MAAAGIFGRRSQRGEERTAGVSGVAAGAISAGGGDPALLRDLAIPSWIQPSAGGRARGGLRERRGGRMRRRKGDGDGRGCGDEAALSLICHPR